MYTNRIKIYTTALLTSVKMYYILLLTEVN